MDGDKIKEYTMKKIKPNLNYHLLGTKIRLDKNQEYNFIPASNIPNYKEKGLIFVEIEGGEGCSGSGFLLNKTEYIIVK